MIFSTILRWILATQVAYRETQLVSVETQAVYLHLQAADEECCMPPMVI
jgi:hypothetical protein